MNHARVVAILRELADALEEDAVPAPDSSRSPARKQRRAREMVRPAGESDPVAAARAARILRERGFG